MEAGFAGDVVVRAELADFWVDVGVESHRKAEVADTEVVVAAVVVVEEAAAVTGSGNGMIKEGNHLREDMLNQEIPPMAA